RFLVTILLGILPTANLHAEINKWSRTGPIGGSISISTITVDPKNPNIILAGSFRSGVFRSIDGRETWHAADSGTVPVWVSSLVINPRDSNIVYAADYDGVFKSIDGGLTWSALETVRLTGCWSVAIDPRNPDTVYAATGYGDIDVLSPGIYKSTDAGKSWQKVFGDPEKPQLTDSFYQLAIDPRNPDTILAGSRNMS